MKDLTNEDEETVKELFPGPGRPDAPGPDVRLTAFEFRLLRDHIHEHCGIYYEEDRSHVLASRLAFRMRLLGLRSPIDYFNHLRFSPRGNDEMDELVPHLTNNETYFFRETAQLEHLVGEIRQRCGLSCARVRVLSCGCSTGEELHTISMMLAEAGIYNRMEIDLMGVDIDKNAITRARASSYSSYSLRATDTSRIKRFFVKDGERYRLDMDVAEKVVFGRSNLLDGEALLMLAPVDFILCRNVFIYFSEDAIRKVVATFHEMLSEGGMLYLGHSESLARITDEFDVVRRQNMIAYMKR